MTIKQIAEKCGVRARFVFGKDGIPAYTESDVEKMLRYVAMEAAEESMNYGMARWNIGDDTNKKLVAIINQILGEE